MVKRFTVIALVLLAVSLVALPVHADLVPMSWGFPVLVQNNSLTGFQDQSQSASDLQSANIAFPDSASGILGTSFPTIGQNSLQNALASNIGFSQQTSSTYFAYPFLSIGDSPIPSMGLL